MLMEINTRANGLLVKNKAKECINGLMGTIMTDNGKRIQLKAMERPVLVGYFMMASFI